MAGQHIPSRDSVPEHKDRSVTFIILFDSSNQDGLEVTKESISEQKEVNATILECSPQALQEIKKDVPDNSSVVILRSGDRFLSSSSCVELVSELTEQVQCVYCDSIIKDGHDEMMQLMFPFSLSAMSSGYMVTNIALSSQLFKSLAINKNLNFLLGHDLILKSSNVTNIRHLAEVGFLLPSRSINAQSEIPLIGSVN